MNARVGKRVYPKQRLHIVSLPHTATEWSFSWCAYTMKALKLARMMDKIGYEVYLYAADGPSDFHNTVACVPHPETSEVTEPQWTPEFFEDMNLEAIIGIKENKRDETDLILCTTGGPQKPIADFFEKNFAVEYGVGYSGTFSKFCCFESYAWMHTVYGFQCGVLQAEPMGRLGIFYDAVIPNYFEVDQFPLGYGLGDAHGPYLLYIGRMIEAKGWRIALDTARNTGMRLVCAGQQYPGIEYPDDIEWVGVVGPEVRAKLMGEAQAVMVPSLYTEPFGGVCVEAQLTGTPVITTDWGAFPELVVQGETGFRCRTQEEFDLAARDVLTLPRAPIRKRAIDLYGSETVAKQYHRYFQRLAGLRAMGPKQ